jgi:hypothetical protein
MSMFIFLPTSTACHKLLVTCTPTEKDITDSSTWRVTYDLDIELPAGCGTVFWIGFNVSEAGQNFHRRLYTKGDVNKTTIDHSGSPKDGDHNDWGGWFDASVKPECPAYYHAVLEVWCEPNTKDFEYTDIIVNVWSTDNNNDIYHVKMITKTTLIIPKSIVYFTHPTYLEMRSHFHVLMRIGNGHCLRMSQLMNLMVLQNLP